MPFHENDVLTTTNGKKFRLIELIGKGASGDVYRAKSLQAPLCHVAIKTFTTQKAKVNLKNEVAIYQKQRQI